MKRNSVSPGVYEGPRGVFWSRPHVRGRRPWRKLRAVKSAAAVQENAKKDWACPASTLADLTDLYLAAGCPNTRLEDRPAHFILDETARVRSFVSFFGPMPAAKLRIADLPAYKSWRVKRVRIGTGERTSDREVQTLSNVLNYGVITGGLEFNFIRSGRPRFQRSSSIRHARSVAPANANAIHALADSLLASVKSETLGWQILFAMFTGCRTIELLRLRLDAGNPDQADYATAGHLFLARSKGGVNPWAMVGPEFAECLDCFHRWHRARFPKSVWYFPSPRQANAPVAIKSLCHALLRATAELQLPHITPHGLRSFCVTKRRSDGVTDAVIAGEIGDQTVSLMQTTYGARPANWTGGAALSWLPATGLPAWSRWQSPDTKTAAEMKTLDYRVDYAEKTDCQRTVTSS